MKKWWDFLKEQFWILYHSPTAFRGWKSLLSGLKIGMIMTATHAMVLLCFGCIVLACYEDRSFRQFFAGGNFGHLLVLSAMFGLFVSISIAAPTYMVGCFDGGRWRGYFDQVVVTGISPLRYISGQIVSGAVSFLLMSLSMIPYLVFGESLGFGGWLWFCYGTLLVILWGIMLMFLFATFAVFFHEALSFILILVFSFGCGFMSLFPFPGLWGGVSPLRYLVQPVLSNFSTSNAQEFVIFKILYEYAFLGYWKIPIALYTPMAYAFLIFLCYRILYVGPRHLVLPGSNNLGVVSFSGDFKKRGFWRMRWNLKRQIDRFFFFENSATHFSLEEKEQYRRSTRFFILNSFMLFFVLGLIGRYWEYFPIARGGPSKRDIFEMRSILLCVFFWPLYYFLSIRTRNEFVPAKKWWMGYWDHYIEFVYYFFFPLIVIPTVILSTPYCSSLFFGSSSSYSAKLEDYWVVLFGTLLIFPYLWSIHLFGRWIATYTYSKIIVSIFILFYIILTHLFILLGIVCVQEFLSISFQEENLFPLYPIWIERIDDNRLTDEALGVAAFFLLIDLFFITFIQRRIKRIQKNLE